MKTWVRMIISLETTEEQLYSVRISSFNQLSCVPEMHHDSELFCEAQTFLSTSGFFDSLSTISVLSASVLTFLFVVKSRDVLSRHQLWILGNKNSGSAKVEAWVNEKLSWGGKKKNLKPTKFLYVCHKSNVDSTLEYIYIRLFTVYIDLVYEKTL